MTWWLILLWVVAVLGMYYYFVLGRLSRGRGLFGRSGGWDFAGPPPIILIPVTLDVEHPEWLSRPLLFVKWLLAIPLYFVMLVWGLLAGIATFFAFWFILFVGAYPEGLVNFITAYLQYSFRVYSYFPLLMTDQWKPAGWHPLSLDIDISGDLSRPGALFLKLPVFLLGIPQSLIAIGLIVLLAIAVLMLPVILIAGTYPRGLFRVSVNILEWVARFLVWHYLLRDDFYLLGANRLMRIGVVLFAAGYVAWTVLSFTSGGVLREYNGLALMVDSIPSRAPLDDSEDLAIRRGETVGHYKAGVLIRQRGQIGSRVRDLQEAELRRVITEADEAVKREPLSASAHNSKGVAHLGLAAFLLGVRAVDDGEQVAQLRRAVDDFDEAVQLQPALGEAFARRAIAFALLQDADNSRRDAQQSESLGIDRPKLEAMIAAMTGTTPLPAPP